MKIYKILILILLISFSCDSKQDKVVSNEVVETKNNDLIILSGDYVFYNNAAAMPSCSIGNIVASAGRASCAKLRRNSSKISRFQVFLNFY